MNLILAASIVMEAISPRPPVPDLSLMGKTSYGQFRQIGRDVYLTEGPAYEASGVIRIDGTVMLVWLHEKKVKWIGVYRFDDGNLVGVYGLPESVVVEKDGRLSGQTSHEEIRSAGK